MADEMWITEPPMDKEDCIITVTDGKRRWTLPECSYSPKTKSWYHKIIDDHDEQVDDPEIGSVHVWQEWERIDMFLDVIAWMPYPDPYQGDE